MDDLNAALEEQSDLFDSSIFGDAANQNIQNLAVSMEKVVKMYAGIAKEEEKLNDLREKTEKLKMDSPEEYGQALEKLNKLEVKLASDSIDAQLAGYRQLFGATKMMFDENSDARKAMHVAELSMAAIEIAIGIKKALVNAVTATTAQGSIPVAGFAMVAAMAVMMGVILSQIGQAFTGGGTSAPSTSPADYTTGSTLYGVEEGTVSESLSNGFEMLEDLNLDQYGALLDIYLEMRRLNANLTGLVTSIVKTGAVDSITLPDAIEGVEGAMFEGVLNGISTFGSTLAFGPIAGALQHIFGDLLSGVLESIGSFLFGGDKSFEVLAQGIGQYLIPATYGAVTMGQVMSGEKDVGISPYLWYEETTEGGVFKDDDKEKKWLYGDKLDDASKFITEIVSNIGETMLELADILGYGPEAIQKIKDYVVDLGTVDLKNLDAEQVQEALSAWFSNFADEMAGDVFSELLTRYQKVDEGLFETAIRLAVEKEMILEVLDMTGQAFNGTALEAVHFSQALIEIAGSLEALTEDAQTYFEEYFTEAEKLTWLTDNLADSYAAIGVEMPASRQEFKNLMESIDLTTDSGQELYVQLLALAGATDAYYDALEAANQTIRDAQRELTGTTDQGIIADIAAKYGWEITTETAFDFINAFINMSIDDVEAYAEAVGVSSEELTDDILALADIFDWAGDAADEAASEFANLADSIRETLQSIRDQIQYDLHIGAGGTASSYYMAQITDLQATEPMTAEVLLAISEKLMQWYNAAASEAQTLAQEEANAAELLIQVADRLESLITSIESAIRSIKYSGLNLALPPEQAAEAASDYATLFAAAKSGGTAEVQEYLGFAQTYLQQQQDAYKSSTTYQGAYATVMGDMETIKALAEAGSYDEAILAEITSGNEDVHADLTAIIATFEEFEGWILNALDGLDAVNATLTIIWDTAGGEEVLVALRDLLEYYGWESDVVITFMTQIAANFAGTFSDRMDILKFVIGDSGWESTATMILLASDDYWDSNTWAQNIETLGFLVDNAPGGWHSDAVLTFLANDSAWASTTYEEAMHGLGFLVSNTPGGWESDAVLTWLANDGAWSSTTWEDAIGTLGYILDANSGDWESDAVLTFLANNGAWSSLTFEDAMHALGYLVDNTPGGWASDAVITWLSNDAAWQSASIEDALALLGFTGSSAGWNAEATVALVAQLADNEGLLWADIEAVLASYGVVDETIIKTLQAAYDAGMGDFPTWNDLADAMRTVGVDDTTQKAIEAAYSGDMTWSELEQLLYATGTSEAVIREIKASVVGNVPVELAEQDVWLAQLELLVAIVQNTRSMADRLGGNFVSIQSVANLYDEDLLGSIPDNFLMNSGSGVWPGGAAGSGTDNSLLSSMNSLLSTWLPYLGYLTSIYARQHDVHVTSSVISGGTDNGLLSSINSYLITYQPYLGYMDDIYTYLVSINNFLSSINSYLVTYQPYLGYQDDIFARLHDVHITSNVASGGGGTGAYDYQQLVNLQRLQLGFHRWSPSHWQEYYFRDGGIATGPASGYPATLHGTEAVVPLKNMNIPVSFLNGGSTQAGTSDEEIRLLKELIDTLKAKDTSPTVNVSVDSQGIIKAAGEYVSEKSRRGTLDVRSH
ncbi:MAG: hypothetical protein HN929_06175 [Chloroflexi bacterium]|nr:hypothetical protein [Chloroflexota bacterium]